MKLSINPTYLSGSDSDRGMKFKPFMKWAGGKQQLLKTLDKYFPSQINSYFEPFLGSGAVFFYLKQINLIRHGINLSDNNKELINTYIILRDKIDSLIKLLAVHQKNHNKDYYYKIRGYDRKKNNTLTDVERAARTIYLNRTCYNGLYRVNSKGQFNVPLGRYETPRILFEDVIRTANQALQGINLFVSDFSYVLKSAEKNDFIYFDPPYYPLSATSNFTSYTASEFGKQEQMRLAEVYATLSQKGCLCMLSNSYTPLILELYKDFRIEVINANRAINSNSKGRGGINEVVILNF